MDEIERLKKENRELRIINANKSDLISVSAHQLRTSLSAIKWILKMMLDKDLGQLTNEQDGFIKKAFDSNERMIALVNDLLTNNHNDAIKSEMKIEEVDILKLVEQILFEFSGETFNKGIELTILHPDNDLPKVNCDQNMIRVVIQNLVENAIKYSYPHGKIVLSLKYISKKNELEMSFHDNGIGIEEFSKDNIFTKFFRADNAIKKERIGSGLGLFTTKEIVEKHNGKIWFKSDKEAGTTFFVELPIN